MGFAMRPRKEDRIEKFRQGNLEGPELIIIPDRGFKLLVQIG